MSIPADEARDSDLIIGGAIRAAIQHLKSATPPDPLPRRERAQELTADDVEWVVNDSAELGVKIGNQFFFCYKGRSLIYEEGTHDDGKPMMWRPVFKREFGECVHPVNYTDPRKIGTVSLDDSDDWKPLPSSLPPSPLSAAPADASSVCACGCPLDQHENYGEDGESCGVDGHDCVRTSPAVLSMLTALRAPVAPLSAQEPETTREARLEALLVSARTIAARRGADTAWERFDASIAAEGVGRYTARVYKVLPSDEVAAPSVPPATTALREAYEAGASELERIARAVPIGAEDTTKGPSVYNWLTYAALRLRQSAALTATEDQQMENTTMPCQKCGSTDGWSGPTYRRQLDHGFISRGYIRWPRVIAETLDWACVRCGYTRHTRTVDHDEEANTLPARRPDSMTRGVDATPPAAPPNTTIYHGSFFSRCFWFGHSYRWRLLEGDWIQQQCEHCPSTGDTQRCYKPAPPPPPPPWMDPNDQVRS